MLQMKSYSAHEQPEQKLPRYEKCFLKVSDAIQKTLMLRYSPTARESFSAT
jgi:hypothetical protein